MVCGSSCAGFPSGSRSSLKCPQSVAAPGIFSWGRGYIPDTCRARGARAYSGVWGTGAVSGGTARSGLQGQSGAHGGGQGRSSPEAKLSGFCETLW